MITPGEIQKGQYVTVLCHKRAQDDGFGNVSVQVIEDRSWIGEVFEVIVVDLPFVALKRLNGGLYNFHISIDTRVTELKECSEEYVNAFKE